MVNVLRYTGLFLISSNLPLSANCQYCQAAQMQRALFAMFLSIRAIHQPEQWHALPERTLMRMNRKLPNLPAHNAVKADRITLLG